MNILVTGALGASGRKLYTYLQSLNLEDRIFSTDLQDSKLADFFQVDLTDIAQVQALLKEVNPDQIYHLAGSFSNNFDIDFQTNVISTKNLFAEMVENDLDSRILLIGSSAEYGYVNALENPIDENHELNPCSIYGLTKVYQTKLMQYFAKMYDIDVLMARTFNLLGPNLSEKLFIGKLYSQIELYKKGAINNLVFGSLDSKRDYITLESAIFQYVKIMNKGKTGEIYNVGSGKSDTMYEILESILSDNGLSMDCVVIQSQQTNGKCNVKDIFANIKKLNELD